MNMTARVLWLSGEMQLALSATKQNSRTTSCRSQNRSLEPFAAEAGSVVLRVAVLDIASNGVTRMSSSAVRCNREHAFLVLQDTEMTGHMNINYYWYATID
jgi:hypothetical protein